MQRVGRILEHKHILLLRRTHAVIVDFMVLVGVGVLFSGLGAVIGAVIEAVAAPVGGSELGPLYVVGSKSASRRVDNIYLSPVGTAARNCVGNPFAVGRHCQTGQSHSAVIRQGIGVEQHHRLGVEGVKTIENRLILKAAVAEKVVFPIVPAPGSALFGIVVEL